MAEKPHKLRKVLYKSTIIDINKFNTEVKTNEENICSSYIKPNINNNNSNNKILKRFKSARILAQKNANNNMPQQSESILNRAKMIDQKYAIMKYLK